MGGYSHDSSSGGRIHSHEHHHTSTSALLAAVDSTSTGTMPLIVADIESTTATASGAGGSRLSATDSESEDLELSAWDHEEGGESEDDDSELEMEGEEGEQEGLAGANRKKRKGRSRRDRSGVLTLGDRMVMDPPGTGEMVSEQERKLADAKVLRSLAINACFIGLWYLFSLLISIYNTWMFSPNHLNFKFPLFTTCLHMVVQFSLASLVLYAFPQFRPGNFSGAHHHHHHQGSGTSTERQKQQAGEMTKWFYITRIGPCGAATGLDIGLGNMSLKFISLAFYTMCKSSSLAFVLLFAFLFRLEKPTWTLVGIIAIMTTGVVMMVAAEAKFVLIGFLLVITASALSGLRWALTQVLLVRNPATSNPFATIFFLAPMMFASILFVAVPVEGFGPLFHRFGELAGEWGLVRAIGVVLFPGFIAFLMVASEFALLMRTSVVTLSICGIFKEVMTITAAAIIFKDPLTPVNLAGLAVTIVSIGGYNWWKIQRMRMDALNGSEGEEGPGQSGHGVEYAPVATGGESGEGLLDEEGESADEGIRRRRRKSKTKKAGKRKMVLRKVEEVDDEDDDDIGRRRGGNASAGSSRDVSPQNGGLEVGGSVKQRSPA